MATPLQCPRIPGGARRTDYGSKDLGCFIASMNGLETRDQQPFWDLARRAHQEIQMFFEDGGATVGYNLAASAYDLKIALSRFFNRSVPKTPLPPQRETLLATNYGVLSMRDVYGSLRPQECTLIFKNEITGPVLLMEALVLGQRLNIGFAADDLDPAFGQFHVAVRGHLVAAFGGAGAASAGA